MQCLWLAHVDCGEEKKEKSLRIVFKKEEYKNQLEQPGLKPYDSPIGFLLNLKTMLDDEAKKMTHINIIKP